MMLSTGDPDIDGGNYHPDPHAGILEGMGRRIDSLNDAMGELASRVSESTPAPAPCQCAERLDALGEQVGAIQARLLRLQLHVYRTNDRNEGEWQDTRNAVLDLARRVRNLEARDSELGREWVQFAQQEGGL